MLEPMKKQKKRPKHKKETPIGIAWYSRQQWELLKHTADDCNSMDDTFERWQSNAQNASRILRQSGYPVEMVDIDVAELIAWCKEEHRPIDGEARADFVQEKIQNSRPGQKPRKNNPENPPYKKSENK